MNAGEMHAHVSVFIREIYGQFFPCVVLAAILIRVSSRYDAAMSKLNPRALGKRSVLTESQIASPRSILDSFPNPRPERDYEIKFVFPEFTSVCPVTGQPDFATITITYVPDKRCVEMKSLKLYFFAYRNKGIFYEAVINAILDDLVATLKPRRMRVVGEFAVRGGTAGIVTVDHAAGQSRGK